MSVVSLKEIPDSSRGGSSKGNFAIEDTRVWRVVTDNSLDNIHTMLASGLFAAHGSGHPNNPWSTLREWNFRQAIPNNGRIWYAAAAYSSQPETKEEKE